jgi:hypothetical protein
VDAFLRETWLRRLLPVFAGLLGALLAWALLGVYGSVFGFAAGFLAGALVLSLRYVSRALGHGPREARMHREAMSQLRAMGALGPMRLASPPARRTSAELRRAIAEMETIATSDMETAIEVGRGLRAAFPKSAAVLSRLAIFERAAGHLEEARKTAAEAMNAALAIGASGIALDVFEDFFEDLERLDLSGPTLLALAEASLRRGRSDAARSCVERLRALDVLEPHTRRALAQLEESLASPS